MKITDMSSENRPRERLEKEGAHILSNAELLATILKSGTKKENVLDMAQRLLAKYDFQTLADCTLQELCMEHGIGKAKASQIVALCEISKRFSQKKLDLPIRKAADVYFRYRKLQFHKQEHFVALYLNTKHQVIVDQTITVGILNASLIHPREVYHGALKNLANSLIVVHNHPSGDPEPSKSDLKVTQQLAKTGDIMGIPLLDHIIIGDGRWWSWKETSNTSN